MSTLALNRSYELQMPSSFVDVDRDEMEYVDGGLGVPNWVFGIAVNMALGAVSGGTAAAGVKFFGQYAKKYGKEAARTLFSKKLKQSLMRKGIASGIASGVCGAAGLGFEFLLNAMDPGPALAKWLDARDPRPNNGWVDIS